MSHVLHIYVVGGGDYLFENASVPSVGDVIEVEGRELKVYSRNWKIERPYGVRDRLCAFVYCDQGEASQS